MKNTPYRFLEIVNFITHNTHTAYHHSHPSVLKKVCFVLRVTHTNTSSHLDCTNLPQLLNIPELLHCIRLQLLLRVHDSLFYSLSVYVFVQQETGNKNTYMNDPTSSQPVSKHDSVTISPKTHCQQTSQHKYKHSCIGERYATSSNIIKHSIHCFTTVPYLQPGSR